MRERSRDARVKIVRAVEDVTATAHSLNSSFGQAIFLGDSQKPFINVDACHHKHWRPIFYFLTRADEGDFREARLSPHALPLRPAVINGAVFRFEYAPLHAYNTVYHQGQSPCRPRYRCRSDP